MLLIIVIGAVAAAIYMNSKEGDRERGRAVPRGFFGGLVIGAFLLYGGSAVLAKQKPPCWSAASGFSKAVAMPFACKKNMQVARR